MKCFACGIELHQKLDLVGWYDQREKSHATCFPGKRICDECEKAFERRPLPKRKFGTIAAETKFHEPKLVVGLAAAVKQGKPFDKTTNGMRVTFTPHELL